jgi:hypothetical protein
MEKQYRFALDAISKGQTVLVYKGVTASYAKHVKTAERLTLVDGVLMVDGVSCAGMTMAIKPGRVK